MDAYEVLLARRSIRRFTAEDVSADDERRLDRGRLRGAKLDEPAPLALRRRARSRHACPARARAPVGGAAAARAARHRRPRRRADTIYWVEDCAAATENILTAATALGLGACWVGIWENGPEPHPDEVAASRSSAPLPPRTAASAWSASAIPPTTRRRARSSSRRSSRTSASAGTRGERVAATGPRGPHPEQTRRATILGADAHGQAVACFSSERWQGEMMDWAMSDERLKVEMLRFVDVFPTLRDRSEIARHLREYFARQGVATPAVLRWGVNLAAQRSAVAPLANAVIRRQMKGFAQRFIVGRDAADAMGALRGLRREGMGFTLDVLGEASVSEAEAEAYQKTLPRPHRRPRRRGALVAGRPGRRRRRLGPAAARQPLAQDHLAVLADRPGRLRRQRRRRQGAAAPDRAARDGRRRRAHARPRAVPLPRPHLQVFTALLDEEEFRALRRRRRRGPGLSARRRAGPAPASSAGRSERGRRFHLRLVKGAYWDYETVIAAQEGWPVPVFTHKPDTDAMYEKLAATMLRDPEHVRPAFASHNVRSLAAAIVTARELGLPDNAFEIQMLHGMGEPIKHAVRAARPAAARVRAGRRAHPRHGLPRSSPAREHGQRLVPAPDLRRGRRGRGARARRRRPRPTSAASRRAAPRSPRPTRSPRRRSSTSRTPTSRARENRDAYDAALAAVRGRLGSALPAGHRRTRDRHRETTRRR